MGNRFANEFYANISSDGELGSCLNIGCAGTFVKELPCVALAIKNRDPRELLKCGVTKADVNLP